MPRVFSTYVPCQNKRHSPSVWHLYLIPNSKRFMENITWPLVQRQLSKLRDNTRCIMVTGECSGKEDANCVFKDLKPLILERNYIFFSNCKG